MPKEQQQPKEPKTTAETPVEDPKAAFARFEQLTRQVLRVPKEAIQKSSGGKPKPP